MVHQCVISTTERQRGRSSEQIRCEDETIAKSGSGEMVANQRLEEELSEDGKDGGDQVSVDVDCLVMNEGPGRDAA